MSKPAVRQVVASTGAIAVFLLAACHAAPDPSTTSPDEDAQLNAAAASLDNAANATEPLP